jgi:hypothetical protein
MSHAGTSAAAAMILTLIDEVRPKTMRLLEATPDDQLLWSPPGTQNHVAWHAGHAVWLADVLCVKPIIGRSELPDGWAQTFGQDGTPPARTTTWPGKSELIRQLAAQHERVKRLVAALSDEDLSRVVSPRSGSTLARWIIHGFHDEATHQGEMYLLLKMRRA